MPGALDLGLDLLPQPAARPRAQTNRWLSTKAIESAGSFFASTSVAIQGSSNRAAWT
jgi:hypothetical protein